MWRNNKRYHTLDDELQNIFNQRVFKVSLNGGFSCPNFKNGTGCIYCSKLGSGDFAGDKNKSLKEQYNEVRTNLDKKWKKSKYIAYFQANTNTYAPLEVLKKKFEEVLTFPDVVGLNIGTRPDSITEECMNYLEDLSKRTYLTIELGLQSMHDKTLKLINRGHDLKCFDDCVKELRKRNINVVVHIINGLPNETKKDMLETVKYLNTLNIQGIKIHMLHVLKNTKLESIYKKENLKLLTKEEYVNIVCDQLEILNPNITIHRLTGDGKKEDLIAPLWTLKKVSVLNDIDKELKKRNTYQGFYKTYLNTIKRINNKMFKQKDYVYIDINKKEIKSLYNKNNIISKKEINDFKNKISLIITNDINIKSISYYLSLLNKKGSLLIISNKKLDISNITNKYIHEDYNIYEIRK